MAKRTNKIDACFTILENKIAKSGSKTVYLRILEPGGKVIGNRSEGSSSFKLTGTNEDVLYTMSKTVDYTNDKQDVCIIWEEADRTYAPGSYMVEVYIEGSLSGVSSLTLR